MRKIFNKLEKEQYLVVARYDNNDRLYIGIGSEDDDIYEDITINLPEVGVDDINEIFLSDDLSQDVIDMLNDKKIIKELGNSIQYNMGHYNRVLINLEVLKEYDPKGVEEFIANNKTYNDMER